MTGESLERAVVTYVTAWNTADESARRDLLERVFAADGSYADPSARIVGREALVAHSRRFAQRAPGSSIAVTSAIDVQGEVACFTWRVTGPDGATTVEGIDFVTAGPDGRLCEVRGFFGAYRGPQPTLTPAPARQRAGEVLVPADMSAPPAPGLASPT